MAATILQQYIQKMERLRVDRAHGMAPHKPILLLTVIELIERGRIPENKIFLTPELAEVFRAYWLKVTDRRPDITLPFFHMKSDGFWHLHPNPGYEQILDVVPRIRGATRFRQVIAHASLDEALFVLLTERESRAVIRQTIIRAYFPELAQELESLVAQNRKSGEYGQTIRQTNAPFSIENSAPIEVDAPTRTGGFRRVIMNIYNYTCVVCRLRILTMDGESVTEAAHIVPFHISHNDDVRNGISLCKLHHWTFDKGLISLSGSYQIIVSELMSEEGPAGWTLTELRGKSVLLPEEDLLYPAQAALEWHREEVFQRELKSADAVAD